MILSLLLALMACGSPAFGQANVDLLAAPYSWTAGIDRGGTKLAFGPTGEAPLAVKVTADGGPEDYPKMGANWTEPQDWSRYMRLRAKLRVTCEDPSVRTKRITFVYYDRNTLREDLPDKPMTQQCIAHNIPCGQWVEIRDWLVGINRTAMRGLVLYLYEDPPAAAHVYTWEVAQLQLEGVGEEAVWLDTEAYDKHALADSCGPLAGIVSTSDGLSLELDDTGRIRGIAVDGKALGAQSGYASGLLVRDVKAGGAPVPAKGTMAFADGAVKLQSALDKLALDLEAEYRSHGEYLEVAGEVRDLRGADRAVTVYLALPFTAENWQWWDNVAVARATATGMGEMTCLESGMEYGLGGMHSKYPIGAMTAPGVGGLTIGVPMDEPVVHRIAFNPTLRTMYLALDFGLVPEKTLKGRVLSEAQFRILLYRHDPQWGFRSALDRYYRFFPEWFEKRAKHEGGWFVWGDMSQTEGALEAGFGFHWGPRGADAIKWDNANGPLALQYIEPELYQQTMGDYDRAPTLQEALERSRKIAAADEDELAKFMKLGYSHYLPGKWEREHSHRESCIAVNRACAASVCYNAAQEPVGGAGQFPWMSESRWGVIFPCNLDPDIPGGKGHFCKELFLETGLKEMQEAGCHYDGIALDSFGGYGMYSRANFRREHFKYSDFPLSFSASEERLPVIPAFFSTIEFAKDLAATMHPRGLVLMANCSWGATPGWLTFLSPYLDIYGAEAPRFADPEFARAIAGHKPCTDLPYQPRPDWEVARNQLLGIFPGHGNEIAVMKRFAPTFQALAQAGWEPTTHATVTGGDGLRVERFGTGATLYFVLHNPSEKDSEAKLRVDPVALGLGAMKLTREPTGEAVTTAGGEAVLTLPGKGTVVVKAQM